MKIQIIQPYATDKKYGIELNRCIETMPDDDWVCVLDWDCMLLSHNQIPMMYEYIARYPDTGLFLAMSNRSGSQMQRYKNQKSENFDMSYWMREAENIEPSYNVTNMGAPIISGFLMLFSKATWAQIKFDETLDILHVDRTFAQSVLHLRKKVHIMQDILVWHSYRLLNGTKDKSHLL